MNSAPWERRTSNHIRRASLMSTPSGGRSHAGGQGQGGGGTGGRGSGASRRTKKKRMPGVNRATGGAGAEEQHVRRSSIVSSSVLVNCEIVLAKGFAFQPPPPSAIDTAVLTLAAAPCALLKTASNAHAPSISDRHREVNYVFFCFPMFLRPDRILFQKVPLHTTLVGSGV